MTEGPRLYRGGSSRSGWRASGASRGYRSAARAKGCREPVAISARAAAAAGRAEWAGAAHAEEGGAAVGRRGPRARPRHAGRAGGSPHLHHLLEPGRGAPRREGGRRRSEERRAGRGPVPERASADLSRRRSPRAAGALTCRRTRRAARQRRKRQTLPGRAHAPCTRGRPPRPVWLRSGDAPPRPPRASACVPS